MLPWVFIYVFLCRYVFPHFILVLSHLSGACVCVCVCVCVRVHTRGAWIFMARTNGGSPGAHGGTAAVIPGLAQCFEIGSPHVAVE